MANYAAERLDHVFAALSDPTRRAILSRLARGRPLTVSDLAEPFVITLPSVMKHLDVLTEVGLVRRSKTGRTVTVEIANGSLKGAMSWLQRHKCFWSTRLDRLVAYAEAKERKAQERDR